MVGREALLTRKYRFIFFLMSATLLFSQTGVIYGQDHRGKLEAKTDVAYAKFSRVDENRDKIVDKAARSTRKHSKEMKS